MCINEISIRRAHRPGTSAPADRQRADIAIDTRRGQRRPERQRRFAAAAAATLAGLSAPAMLAAPAAAAATAAAATTAAAAAAVPTTAAPTPTVASWSMNDVTGPMVDAIGPLDGVAGPAVGRDGASYYFPGWTHAALAGSKLRGAVDPYTSAARIPNAAGAFTPLNGSFGVAVTLRMQLLADGRLPDRAGASYNVVQVGLATDPGGMWKLEIAGDGPDAGHPRCVARGRGAPVSVVSTASVADGGWHVVVCHRAGDSLTVVTDGAFTSLSGPIGTVRPSGRYASDLWVGKKPGSTDPSDAFAGWLDNLIYLQA